MVLGSPLLHALSGLARARLGWLCPRAWGGELVVRVSNRNVIAHCMERQGSRHKFLAVQPHMSRADAPVHGMEF